MAIDSQHCIIFQIRKRNELTQSKFMLSFVKLFAFNQSKNNVVLELRTGHFRGLVGFKAKDLSFESKAKDFKMCPGGRPQGQARP